jgi:hypothetical protein
MTRATSLLSLLLLTACGEPADDTTPIDTSDTSDTDAVDLSGQPAELRNTPTDCKRITLVAPELPVEAGLYAAARLRPLAWPATITDVAYGLPNAEECDAGLAHKVIVFAVDAGVPVEDPAAAPGAQTLDYEASPEGTGLVTVELALRQPITLTEGLDLFVAIQLTANADASASICIASCADDGGTPGVNWWSETTEAPFTWSDLVEQYGISEDLMVSATGTY